MGQSTEFATEIYDQWYECEEAEISNYRQQFGENPNTFKTFAWGYTRATQNIINIVKSIIKENRLLHWNSNNVHEFVDDVTSDLNKKLKELGIIE